MAASMWKFGRACSIYRKLPSFTQFCQRTQSFSDQTKDSLMEADLTKDENITEPRRTDPSQASSTKVTEPRTDSNVNMSANTTAAPAIDESETVEEESVESSSALIDAFGKFKEMERKIHQPVPEPRAETEESFATMFRKSKYVQLGTAKDKVMVGKIMEVVGEDLYIDIGAKFYCVCKQPRTHGYFKRGAKVRVMLKDFEMSSSFLGSSKHITLLEAEAVLLGRYSDTKPGVR